MAVGQGTTHAIKGIKPELDSDHAYGVIMLYSVLLTSAFVFSILWLGEGSHTCPLTIRFSKSSGVSPIKCSRVLLVADCHSSTIFFKNSSTVFWTFSSESLGHMVSISKYRLSVGHGQE